MFFNFLRKLFSRNNNNIKKKLEPIIPDHRKEKINLEEKQIKINNLKNEHIKIKNKKIPFNKLTNKMKDSKLVDLEIDEEQAISLFKVTGIYNTGLIQMITGFVETGILKKGMKTIVDQTQLIIVETRQGMEKIDHLIAGQEGTVVIKSKKYPGLKKDDYLEFE